MTTGLPPGTLTCKKIHRGGNAELCQSKYKEAVAVAVEVARAGTLGVACYILHDLLALENQSSRAVIVRDSAGVAHVSSGRAGEDS